MLFTEFGSKKNPPVLSHHLQTKQDKLKSMSKQIMVVK